MQKINKFTFEYDGADGDMVSFTHVDVTSRDYLLDKFLQFLDCCGTLEVREEDDTTEPVYEHTQQM